MVQETFDGNFFLPTNREKPVVGRDCNRNYVMGVVDETELGVR